MNYQVNMTAVEKHGQDMHDMTFMVEASDTEQALIRVRESYDLSEVTELMTHVEPLDGMCICTGMVTNMVSGQVPSKKDAFQRFEESIHKAWDDFESALGLNDRV